MGVSVVHYAIIGIELDEPSEEFFDKFEADISTKREAGELIILHDGMNGQYTIVGEVLTRGSEECGFALSSFGPGKINKLFSKVEKRIQDHFGIKHELGVTDRVSLHIVTHYH
jgi:hypothetical protein